MTEVSNLILRYHDKATWNKFSTSSPTLPSGTIPWWSLTPVIPNFDESRFVKHDWGNCYGKVKETIPPNAPPAREKEVVIRCFVDADHEGDELTRRSRTEIITYMNITPIVWHSKRQNSVKIYLWVRICGHESG